MNGQSKTCSWRPAAGFDWVRLGWNSMTIRKNVKQVTPSSGNVFADLGLPNAEEIQTRVRLAVAINEIIED
jgi:hypothetical protein